MRCTSPCEGYASDPRIPSHLPSPTTSPRSASDSSPSPSSRSTDPLGPAMSSLWGSQMYLMAPVSILSPPSPPLSLATWNPTEKSLDVAMSDSTPSASHGRSHRERSRHSTRAVQGASLSTEASSEVKGDSSSSAASVRDSASSCVPWPSGSLYPTSRCLRRCFSRSRAASLRTAASLSWSTGVLATCVWVGLGAPSSASGSASLAACGMMAHERSAALGPSVSTMTHMPYPSGMAERREEAQEASSSGGFCQPLIRCALGNFIRNPSTVSSSASSPPPESSMSLRRIATLSAQSDGSALCRIDSRSPRDFHS
mmetsp:Transcript_3841/g.9154  ORF Transcript_3841/g.9154 Transcript_3841/m.9154 type:complete len:313 (-) Transcript_3841:96-1034(-)